MAHYIEKDKDYFAELITSEMGKPITQAKGEVAKSITHCKYYGKNLERFLKNDRVALETSDHAGVMY